MQKDRYFNKIWQMVIIMKHNVWFTVFGISEIYTHTL